MGMLEPAPGDDKVGGRGPDSPPQRWQKRAKTVMIGRIIAWLFIVLALIALGRDALIFVDSGKFAMAPLGALWYAIDRSSLNLLQAVVERYISPTLWNPVIFTVLQWWAWAVFLVPGIALFLIFRRDHKKKKHRWHSGTFD
jgi:hypothetical protein